MRFAAVGVIVVNILRHLLLAQFQAIQIQNIDGCTAHKKKGKHNERRHQKRPAEKPGAFGGVFLCLGGEVAILGLLHQIVTDVPES